MGIILIVVSLIGCLPIVQTEKTSITAMDVSYEQSWPEPSYLLVTFLDEEIFYGNPEIVEDLSYVVDSDGKRYKIKHEKHQYDVDQGAKFPRNCIYVLKDNGKIKKSLESGIWKLIIVVKDKDGRLDEIKSEFKLWTFYYNPIIHGPPN